MSIKIETDESGFWLVVEHDSETVERKTHEAFAVSHTRIRDPEAFYDHVKAVIGPWLRERDEAKRLAAASIDRLMSGRGLNYENAQAFSEEAYDISDPKHPDFHSIHADIWDAREGK